MVLHGNVRDFFCEKMRKFLKNCDSGVVVESGGGENSGGF